MTDIQRKLRLRHAQSGYKCENCGEPSTEIAHKISKGKYGRKAIKLTWIKLFNYEMTEKEIDEVVHHRLNTFSSCKSCNDYFNLHISQTQLVENLLRAIHTALSEEKLNEQTNY